MIIRVNSHDALQVVFRRLGMKVLSGFPCLGLGVDPLNQAVGDGIVLDLLVELPRRQPVERESSLDPANGDDEKKNELHIRNSSLTSKNERTNDDVR